MENQSNKNSIITIARLCLILSFLSTFITVAFSYALLNAHLENEHLATFLSKASTVQSDFEQSLVIYTENTQSAMNFVDSLRPNNETEYIDFISTVEELGQKLGLDLKLESIGTSKEALHFSANFYGSKKNMNEFLTGLENLNYYTRVETLSYNDIKYTETTNETLEPNIKINFLLYVK